MTDEFAVVAVAAVANTVAVGKLLQLAANNMDLSEHQENLVVVRSMVVGQSFGNLAVVEQSSTNIEE